MWYKLFQTIQTIQESTKNKVKNRLKFHHPEITKACTLKTHLWAHKWVCINIKFNRTKSTWVLQVTFKKLHKTFLMASLYTRVFMHMYIGVHVYMHMLVYRLFKLSSIDGHLSCFHRSPFFSVPQLSNFFRSIIQFSLPRCKLILMFIILFLQVLLFSLSNLPSHFASVF